MWIGITHSILKLIHFCVFCILELEINTFKMNREYLAFCEEMIGYPGSKWGWQHLAKGNGTLPHFIKAVLESITVNYSIQFKNHKYSHHIFPSSNFSVSCFFLHICCTMLHFPQHVTAVLLCFAWFLWKYLISAFLAVSWKKKNLQPSSSKKKEKGFFFFTYFFHVEWLNFTLHWHIWGDAPWNQSNSGISEEEYFWKLQRYVVTLLLPALDRLLYYVTAVILVACLLGW